MYKYIILCVFVNFSVVFCNVNRNEGAECDWDGLKGVCVEETRCLSTLDEEGPKPPVCSKKSEESYICCTDCELVNDTRKLIFDSRLGLLNKTGQKASDKCLEYIHTVHYPCKYFTDSQMTRTLNPDLKCHDIGVHTKTHDVAAASGGVDAYRQQFPHMALLGYGDSVTSADWLCGGSVISERYILTAAHCLSSPAVGQVKYIALGILKRTDPPELWQKYNVTRIIAHPEYKPPSKYHDIALLETDRPISFEKDVRPACLHTEGEAMATASATGWGALGHRRQLADTLQAVYLSRFQEEQCLSYYPPHRHLKKGYNHTTQMCYGDLFEPKDTCQGDSGGPLQSESYGNGCVYTILGVTSYGRQCGISGGSGMYTRVYHYVPWIESVVWP